MVTRSTRREFIKTAGGFVSAVALAPELLRVAEAAEKDRFNILFLMTDQQNHYVMGCSGNPVVKTPTLDKLAGEGARFTNAICATPFCSPTRASWVTGLWPHSHGIVFNVNDEKKGLHDKDTLTEQILFDKGYETFQMGKWHLGETARLRCYRKEQETLSPTAYNRFLKSTPRDKWHRPREGEVEIEEVCYTPEMAEFHNVWKDEKRRSPQDLSMIGRFLRPPEYNYESWLADRCVDLIRKYRDGNFMITWSVSPPHAHWIVPDPYYSMYDPENVPFPSNWTHRPEAYQGTQPARMGKLMGEKRVREFLRCYYGQVTMMDWCMGRILDALSKEGLEQNTLVIFTSDHGDMQGAHGMIGKSVPAYYEEIVRVPLIIRYPRSIKAGTIINTHAHSVDIMPTLLDYAGLPIPEEVQGVSLRPLLDGKASDDDRPGFCERGKLWPRASRMIRTRRRKYAVHGNKRRELFDLENDPHEVKNLSGSSTHQSRVADLHKKLRRHMKETTDPVLDKFPKT